MAKELTREEVKSMVHDAVLAMLRSDQKTEELIMKMVANGMIQFHKTIYTRRGFWKSEITDQAQ